MDESPLQLVSEIGDHLGRRARPNKDFLVKSLRQAANALSQIEQPLETFQKTEAVKKLEAAINPLRKSILKHGLIKHTDKEVKLLVAICVSEVFRVLAPEPPFEDKYLRDIFILFLNMFKELSDTASPHFLRRVKVLETVARCKCCVIMLDVDCHDLVLEMFNIFFSSVREHHQRSLIDEILSIMKLVLNEEASQALSDVILLNLIKEGKAAPPAASQLAASVIQTCEEKLEPFVCGFLTSCFLDRDAVDSELKEFYHEILFKVFQCAPHMLLGVIPNLTQELLTDQVDVRIKAVKLIGKLLALPEHHVVQKYHNLFVEFKNRFSDKSAEVRLSALQCAKACYIANPSGNVSHEILTALEGRLLDFDDRVRTQAAVVACDLARTNLRFFPPELISKVAERLRDKKISVRKKALEKLMEVYREYCIMCFEGPMTASDHFEQIPCKVLMLSYDKDCKDFRPQNMELVIAEDLFPVFLPVEERTRHWIHLFSLFTSSHVKALISILSQKRRLQTEMQIYLAQRKKEKESSSEEMERRIKTSFVKMSASFPDPLKAEECFHKLNQMKDSKTFNALEQLLDDRTIKSAQQTRDKFLKMIGDKHPHFEFLQLLSSKCSFNIFSSEHVQYILDHISSSGFEQHLKASAKLLLAIISVYPSFMRGLEQQFQLLLEENNSINDTLVEVLAKAGPHIKAKFSEFYPLLERICLKGTRFQSKHAVSAIAALFGSSDEFIFSKLCKELVDSLYSGLNTPTVLQSLGCIAQHSVSAFEAQNQEIRSYIFGRIFQAESSEDEPSADETSDCCDSCKLKIYALKALVKSFLPHRGSHGKLHINELLDTLSKLLQTGYAFDGITSCENDKPHIKLAAAKSVLQLSRRWDLHISPEIFRFTVLMAKEPCPLVKRLFLDKMHKLLKEHAIPSRYACAYALAASDHCKDLQDAALKNIEEFIKDYSRKAQIRQTSGVQGSSLMDYPAYIVVFLIHVLAHDAGFPPDGCQDEQVYAQFCSPLFWALQALVNANVVNGDTELINEAALYLLSIFRAIKKTEDAVDAHQTPKLLILAEIGISIVNELNHVISSSLAPKQISLPSSLYRISVVKKCDKTSLKCLTKFSVDESFVKRVVHILKSQISGPATTTLSKRRRKVQEVTIQSSDIEHNTSNPASQKIASLSLTGTREKQKAAAKEIGLGYTRKRALSPIDSESMVLQNEHPATVMHRDDASKSSKSVLEKKQRSSSRASATTKLSQLESHVSSVDRIIPSLKENAETSKSITASNYPRAELKEPHSLRISYDSGDLLCLDSESHENMSDNSLLEKETLLTEVSNTFHPIHCSQRKTSSAFRDGAAEPTKCLASMENGRFSQRAISFPAKGKKGQKALLDISSASENVLSSSM
ncbi:PRECOCIOUS DISSOCIATION OF SISTERS 5 ISOFORM A [Salix purpurea]|uniref:PRECOCIOUS DISSOCIATION OF SISTERS 5 ISOFORM A n=1 Tax=Salix purpurea TaxID=77065 RepID=A0A9Q0SQJ6_SALPP|nr:PRECOCIOUS DISSOCIATION OF SISTERS 5 ISOFORM A [Salix purpurea]